METVLPLGQALLFISLWSGVSNTYFPRFLSPETKHGFKHCHLLQASIYPGWHRGILGFLFPNIFIAPQMSTQAFWQLSEDQKLGCVPWRQRHSKLPTPESSGLVLQQLLMMTHSLLSPTEIRADKGFIQTNASHTCLPASVPQVAVLISYVVLVRTGPGVQLGTASRFSSQWPSSLMQAQAGLGGG